MAGTGPAMPGLRGLRLHLPDVPLFRHRRRRGRGARRAGKELGRLPVRLFTLHASGHNPRSQQAQRQRQRIYHKFRIYPQKFGTLLCTGCGNCTRNCPVGLGVRPVLAAIGRARQESDREITGAWLKSYYFAQLGERHEHQHLPARPDGSRSGPPADGRREIGPHPFPRRSGPATSAFTSASSASSPPSGPGSRLSISAPARTGKTSSSSVSAARAA